MAGTRQGASPSGGGGGSILNTPYDPNTWLETTDGASRLSIRNKIESMGYLGNVAYVDNTYGNDSTGVLGNILKPFATHAVASAYISSGTKGLIVTFPGTYTITSPFGFPMKNNVDHLIFNADIVQVNFAYGIIMIYPVPDPDLPFLGVHLTPMIDGSVSVGPNAVLGLSREGYRKGSVSLRDIAEMAAFPGFWRGLARNIGPGLQELRNSLSRQTYLDLCRRYCPGLELDDLQPMEAGIRAQAVMANGDMQHDFLFAETDLMLHVLNAPSPAATSALPIGDMIAERLLGRTE